MYPSLRLLFLPTALLILLGALPLVSSHDDHPMDMATSAPPLSTPTDAPPSYYRHPHYTNWILAHIFIMILAWCVVLPPAIMLSVARSRYHLPAQLVFHLVNSVGLFTGFVYNHSTPDLYPHNAHHPLGWIMTALTVLWTGLSLVVAYGEYRRKRTTPVTTRAMAQHSLLHRYTDDVSNRYSRDSGHGTERNSTSLRGSRQNSQDSIFAKPEAPSDDDDETPEHTTLLHHPRIDRFLSTNLTRFNSPTLSKALRLTQILLEKLLIPLAFTTLTTGFITHLSPFHARAIFSGLAHAIKGGIFFFYGLLTLARWFGAFAEFAWAWNRRPSYPAIAKWKIRVPSAEFVESAVIFLYGASNVFLEHLNAWGKEWTAQDLEHVSITVLFFGGGLLGMVVESGWVRSLASTTLEVHEREEEVEEASEAVQSTSSTPLNPLPSLVIFLLGLMMSSHHQTSMTSTMLHAAWGSLLSGFSLARGVTYALLYLRPVTSQHPARPPSELIAAFCLTAGGLMFMLSARDCVTAMEGSGVDAMAVFMVVMGGAAVVMAWVVVCLGVKGWAVRRERRV